MPAVIAGLKHKSYPEEVSKIIKNTYNQSQSLMAWDNPRSLDPPPIDPD
jgi:hypothetical protein